MAKKEDLLIGTEMENLISLCKRRGFISTSGELYGGLAGFFDFGPNGVELKNNIKALWWKKFVQDRDDVVGMDGSIITHPKTWLASGHVDSFNDPLVECKKCHSRHRADLLIELELNESVDGISEAKLQKLLGKHKLVCPKCKGELTEIKNFNLMFETFIGALKDEKSKAFLRPETAQQMFTNFKTIVQNFGLNLPFGIAQIGKAFRNEISPRNFVFRGREFEQLEIEFFLNPEKINDCPFLDEVKDVKLNVLTAEAQKKKAKAVKMQVKQMLSKKLFSSAWLAYWTASQYQWFLDLGVSEKKLRIRQHLDEERAHYARDTWDIDYEFPFGWKELEGISDRGQFDLTQHAKHANTKMEVIDPATNQKVLPAVIEPSLGLERAMLVFLLEAFSLVNEKIALKLHPKLFPRIAVFPLVKDKKLAGIAKKIQAELKEHFLTAYSDSAAIGKRYAREDEIGTPYCITVDFDSLKDKKVTVRNRDTTKQKRVLIREIAPYLLKQIKNYKKQ